MLGHGDGLERALARRDDVLDDQHALAGLDPEAAAQRERAVDALGEDRAHAEAAPDLVADDQAAHRRREHHVDLVARRLHLRRECLAERLGVGGVLQDQRALQVAGAVQPGGQDEVALEQGATLAEQGEDGVRGHMEPAGLARPSAVGIAAFGLGRRRRSSVRAFRR